LLNDEFSMTQDELDAFLGACPKYCALATVRRDGSPLVIPVGYLYEQRLMYFTFAPERSAVKRIRHEPRICITVFNDRYPVQFAVIVGTAEEVEDPRLALSRRKFRWMMQLAPDSLDLEEFERNYFLPGSVVFRIRVTLKNVSSSDGTKMKHPETEGALLVEERRRYLGQNRLTVDVAARDSTR
jgi:nitroimidazol reductase NimA-like FMN-containing flavoprotein (pyridoxamine 5'-phosphate oxidase superfamily)